MIGDVTIRKFTEDDIALKVDWINDPQNNKYLHYELPLESEKTREWYFRNKGSSTRYDGVIEFRGIPVGIIGLLSIEDGRAEFYITMGERQYTGCGIAKMATRLLLSYAFSQLSLDTVYLYTEVDNIAAQHLFERCGFKRGAYIKASAVNRGVLVDRYYYEVSAGSFVNEV